MRDQMIRRLKCRLDQKENGNVKSFYRCNHDPRAGPSIFFYCIGSNDSVSAGGRSTVSMEILSYRQSRWGRRAGSQARSERDMGRARVRLGHSKGLRYGDPRSPALDAPGEAVARHEQAYWEI